MRRLSRLIHALGSPPALWVLVRLLEGAATQNELKNAMRGAGVSMTQGTLSPLMIRLEDLGLVDRDNRKAPYRLRHPDATAGALLHLAELGLEMSAEETSEAEALQTLARRVRLRSMESSQDAV
jgi:arginine repressor